MVTKYLEKKFLVINHLLKKNKLLLRRKIYNKLVCKLFKNKYFVFLVHLQIYNNYFESLFDFFTPLFIFY